MVHAKLSNLFFQLIVFNSGIPGQKNLIIHDYAEKSPPRIMIN